MQPAKKHVAGEKAERRKDGKTAKGTAESAPARAVGQSLSFPRGNENRRSGLRGNGEGKAKETRRRRSAGAERIRRNQRTACVVAAKKSLSPIVALPVGLGNALHTTITTFSLGFM